MISEQSQKQAVIYCRVSSIKQRSVGDGLKSQETRCREFARMKGYDVIDVFADDVSGGLTERPAMSAMLAFMKKRRAKGTVVIIDDVSRLARGLQQHLELRQLIAGSGGTLESPSIEFGEDPDSILVENLLASVSQHQRQKNGEQTKNRMRSRVYNGYWVFQAPVGYKYQLVRGRGKMLMRDEPVASVLQEALEGYASGRFESQADIMRFLQAHPLFPKAPNGKVTNQRVSIILNQCAYAGFVEAPKWGIARRSGQHEALISVETWQRIQERLKGIDRAPYRKDLSVDFPLRGYVVCADCETPLTACWSKGSHSKHPYYLCPKRGCDSYGKSIRRDKIEGEFDELLQNAQPTEALFRVATMMFKDLWARRSEQVGAQRKAMVAQLQTLDKKVSQLLERIMDANTPSVIAAYEERIAKIEEDKLVLQERIADAGRPRNGLDETLRTALGFLSNPCNLWRSERFEDKRAVLKLAFADRLQYTRRDGFRTAEMALPFKVLGAFNGGEKEMAHPTRFERVTSAFGGQINVSRPSVRINRIAGKSIACSDSLSPLYFVSQLAMWDEVWDEPQIPK